ncbi:MAG: hypothetical protein ABMA64_22885 [Myxococcota bacterium]
MTEAELQRRIDEIRASNPDLWHPDTQAALQGVHLQRADALGSTVEAEAHLRAAEDCQWSIGTAATGAGEGLASMGRLYEIRARRARLWEALGDRAAARDLWESIAADPNGLGAFAKAELARLG